MSETVEIYGDYIAQSVKFQKLLYSPMKKKGFIPENGSEVFVRQIPARETEYDLLKFFHRVGKVFQVRLMMAESGTKNRGFGYITYFDASVAKEAVETLKNVPYKERHYLVIEHSLNNCRLFIGGIPTYKRKDQVWQELYSKGVKNIIDVIMYRSYSDRAENRGFVFVEFRTHEEAAYFRAKFAKSLKMWDYPVVVDWSVPVPQVDEDVMSTVKIIYLRNLDVCQTREDIQNVVLSFTAKANIEKVYKFKNYAFIHVVKREIAERLMEKLKDFYKDTAVEITWAKPPSKFTTQDYRHSKVSSLSAKSNPSTSKQTNNCPNCCKQDSNRFEDTKTANDATLSPTSSSSTSLLPIGAVARSLSPYETFCMELSGNLDDVHSSPKFSFNDDPRNHFMNNFGLASRNITFDDSQEILLREFQVSNDMLYTTERKDLIPYERFCSQFAPSLSSGQLAPAFFTNDVPQSYQTAPISPSTIFDTTYSIDEAFGKVSQSNELSLDSLSISPNDLGVLPRNITLDEVQDLVSDMFD